jgi:spermidine synthase
MAAVAGAATSRRATSVLTSSAAALTVLLGIFFWTPPWNRQLMSSGMTYYASYLDKELKGTALVKDLESKEELLYYRDGLTATVTVTRERKKSEPNLLIATNGKYDGSSGYDLSTQRLSAHLPLLLHPSPRDVCIVGMGTGCTAGSAALYPQVERITVAEIEDAMVEGSRHFASVNHDVHKNPKVRIEVTDGRLWLRLRPGAYDVAISEPSSCWLAGASDLFTSEFWRLGRRALKPGGIFLQWIQLYGMSPENFQIVVRTFQDVFPNSYLCSSSLVESDVLMVGSMEPLVLDAEQIAARMRPPRIRDDLAVDEVSIFSAVDLLARIRLGPKEVRPLGGTGPLNTDELPRVAYTAPRDQYRSTGRENSALIGAHARGIGGYLPAPSRRQLEDLAAAYRRFLGRFRRLEEAAATEELIRALGN